MGVKLRWLFGIVLAVAAGSALAQGGQGGGGYGGVGGLQGGFGGGGGRFAGEDEEVNRSLFLSPSDRTEWEFEAKADEAIFVSVTSSVFDPAVTIVDDKGKKLAENDDIEPGNQSARLVYVLPAPGKYRAVVTNYKGTAGGQFNLNARKLTTYPIRLGELTTPPEAAERGARWARFTLDKPGEYVMTMRGSGGGEWQSYDPKGESVSLLQYLEGEAGYRRATFRAEAPGTYLFRVPGRTPFRVAPITPRTAASGATTAVELGPDEVQEWTIKGKEGEILEVALIAEGAPIVSTLDYQRQARPTEPRAYVPFFNQANPIRHYVAMQRDGEFGLSVRSPRGLETAYTLRIRPTGKPMPAGPIASKLDWYDAEVWTLNGKAGDVLRLEGAADTYMLHMTVLQPDGTSGWAVTSGRPPSAKATIEMKATGRYVVVVSGTGIGPYRLTRNVTEPRRLAADVSRGEVKGGPEVWRFAAEKGQDLAFRITSPSLRWRVVVTSPDGKQTWNLVNDDLLRIKFPATGDYTLTVQSEDGSTGPYQIRRIDLDK